MSITDWGLQGEKGFKQRLTNAKEDRRACDDGEAPPREAG